MLYLTNLANVRRIRRKNSNERVKGPFESGDLDENGENV